MSMIWTSTMPLLSTLAALVIIVHSAEEDLDPGYRRDLRPRVMDPGINSYEQPWKAIDAVPQSTHVLAEPLDEPKVRRRPIRKRRRRPQTSRETEPDEGSQNPYLDNDYDSSQTTEFARRRRKRPDVRVYRYSEEQADTKTRPLRKLSLRKKRPTIRTYPQLSELNGWGSMELHQEENERTEPPKNYDSEEGNHKHYGGPDFYSEVQTKSEYNNHFDNSEEMRGNKNVPTRVEMDEDKDNVRKNSSLRVPYSEQDATEDLDKSEELRLTSTTNVKTTKRKEQKRPNTFSEFSVEDVMDKSSEAQNNNQNDTHITDSTEPTYSTDVSDPTYLSDRPRKLQMNPLDAISLKQILKRSNGTSLSEILQRHNLSLTDLLQGKGVAFFSIKNDSSTESPNQGSREIGETFHDESHEETHQLKEAESKYTQQNKIPRKQQKLLKISTKTNEDAVETTTVTLDTNSTEKVVNIGPEIPEKIGEEVSERPQMIAKRRFPDGIRRKLRMRPTFNTTLKAQLGRDLIALSARKHSLNNKTASKAKEWKFIIPMMKNRTSPNDNNTEHVTEIAPTTTEYVVETTVSDWENYNTSYSSFTTDGNVKDNEVENSSISVTEPTTTIIIEVFPGELINYTDKPPVVPIVRPAANNSGLRLQAFNNRLKRKRLKQKVTPNAAVEPHKSFYGMPNLVSASEFIERTQKPYTTVTQKSTESVTELEDFMTTQTPQLEEVREKPKRTNIPRFKSTSMTKAHILSSTTEQSAKFEIEEILNDTMTSERLGKILKERNMTLGELVDHRERGSSHVHLADIFHNASKEPNPPEPFLTKSSIEPISKETYPLRAILEANTHDSSSKPTNEQIAIAQGNYNHIPVVMDFGNNVNENGENIGILSLFGKYIENNNTAAKAIRQDSDGTPYVSSVVSLNVTINDTKRESRVLSEQEDKEWRKILTIMQQNNITAKAKESPKIKTELPLPNNKKSIEEDVDGDGLIILEDLQHLKDFDSNIASGSDEKLEVKMYERSEVLTEKPGILSKFPSNARSVAIATASILGLSMILFLLTYIVLKYKQQRKAVRKDSFCDEKIPSPVFEHRKSHKNNCSSRSISPMISNSNIYTMSTLDSHNGNDSPEYMWNSLRKPFQ